MGLRSIRDNRPPSGNCGLRLSGEPTITVSVLRRRGAVADDGVRIGMELHGPAGAGLAALVTAAAVAVVVAAMDAVAALGGAGDAVQILQANLGGPALRAGLGRRLLVVWEEADTDRLLGAGPLVAAFDGAIAPWLGDVTEALALLAAV